MAVTKPSIITTSLFEKVGQVFTLVYFATLDRVKKRKEYLKTIRELEKMSDRDLSDIGFSRGEIKARAQALGEELAAQPRQAVRSMLEVVVGHETKSLAESMEDEVAAVAANRGTKDSEEGMRAFMEKRTPSFTGT